MTEQTNELPHLNDPKIQEALKKACMDVSNQWTIMEGYRATVSEALKGVSEEHKIPLRLLRKLARAYHRQTFQTEVQEAESFQEVYGKVFGEEA